MASASLPSFSAFGGAGGVVVLAGCGFMPARLLQVSAGTPLPPGVHAVAALPATAVVPSVGLGSRALHLVARAAAGGVVASLSLNSSVLASLCLGDAADADALATLSLAGVLPSLSVDDATNADALASFNLGDPTNADVLTLASLSLGTTGAAAGGPARASAGAGAGVGGLNTERHGAGRSLRSAD